MEQFHKWMRIMEPSCCKKCMAYRFIVDENVLNFFVDKYMEQEYDLGMETIP